MIADIRSRALETLGLPGEATTDEATAAFLGRVAQSNFVPATKDVAAVNSLASLALPNDGSDAGEALRDEVEEFARDYWSFTPTARTAAWLSLSSRSPDDPTAERLVSLQAGLELPGTPLPDPAEEIVASAAREFYVLQPRERAIRRNQWLLANADRHLELVSAATVLQKNAIGFAALEPVLFERLTTQFKARLFFEGAKDATLPSYAVTEPAPITYHSPTPDAPAPISYTSETPAHARGAARSGRRPTSTESSGSGDKAMGWVVIVLIIFAVRVFSALSGSNSNQPPKPAVVPQTPYAPYSSQGDPYKLGPPYNDPLANVRFTAKQIEEFKEYERAKARGETPPQPVGMTTWVLMNRPEAGAFVYRDLQKPSQQKTDDLEVIKPNSGRSFSSEEVEQFRVYESRSRKIGLEPPRYKEWVELKRPVPPE
jgi:hypothetical protein